MLRVGGGDGERLIVEEKIRCPGESVSWHFESMGVGCLRRIVGWIREHLDEELECDILEV